MSVNREKPHILIVPEDDENRQVANGFFVLGCGINRTCYQVLGPAGGWPKTFDFIKDHYSSYMKKYTECRMVLIIDFDDDLDRLENNMCRIPDSLKDRVFVIGIISKKPKDLGRETGKSLEELGVALAEDCAKGALGLWEHGLLKHNKAELKRLRDSVTSFLFENGSLR